MFKLTAKAPEPRFIVNFKHISHLFLESLSLTLNMFCWVPDFLIILAYIKSHQVAIKIIINSLDLFCFTSKDFNKNARQKNV